MSTPSGFNGCEITVSTFNVEPTSSIVPVAIAIGNQIEFNSKESHHTPFTPTDDAIDQ